MVEQFFQRTLFTPKGEKERVVGKGLINKKPDPGWEDRAFRTERDVCKYTKERFISEAACG